MEGGVRTYLQSERGIFSRQSTDTSVRKTLLFEFCQVDCYPSPVCQDNLSESCILGHKNSDDETRRADQLPVLLQL